MNRNDETNTWADFSVIPKRVTDPDYVPREYRGPLAYPCLACNALNLTPRGHPVPYRCPACGSGDIVTPPRRRPIAFEGQRWD